MIPLVDTSFELIFDQVIGANWKGKMAQERKERVLLALRDLTENQIETLCTKFNIIIKEGSKKVTKRSQIYNTVVRYLSSEDIEESEDEGLEIFSQMDEQIREWLEPEEIEQDEEDAEAVKIEDKNDEALDSLLAKGSTTLTRQEAKIRNEEKGERRKMEEKDRKEKTPRKNRKRSRSESDAVSGVSVQKIKLRDFKINGTVGVRDTEGALDWSSLSYQLKEGLNLGHHQREIISGVIKAMKPGSSLRKYFESKPNIKWENFLNTLKAIYEVKDSGELLDQMTMSIQEPTEPAMTFILRMMAYRDSIFEANEDEECPLDERLIQKKFSNSVIIGLRSATLRLELKPLIMNTDMSDDQILKEINKILTQHKESEKKFNKTGKSASVKLVEAARNESRDDQIIAQLNQLNTNMIENQRHVQELEKKIEEYKRDKERRDSRGNQNNTQKKKFLFKCAQCERNGAFCNHCTNCGASDHKRNSPNCPKNH